jgi:acyl-CoA synthetase (AMP-forming)/AMP-acid ligase II
VIETSILAALRERASLQPNDTAFTFIDYEQDWEGVAESLTWAQLYRRSLNLATGWPNTFPSAWCLMSARRQIAVH